MNDMFVILMKELAHKWQALETLESVSKELQETKAQLEEANKELEKLRPKKKNAKV